MSADLNDLHDWPAVHSGSLLVKAGRDGAIVATSSSWPAVLGWDEHELRNMRLLDLVHPDDKQQTTGALESIDDGDTPSRFSNRYRHKNGSYRNIAWAVIADERYLHAAGRDITAETEARAALEATQETLREAQKMDALGQLAGGIGHEFNNLMQSIVASLELTRRLTAAGRAAETEKFVVKAIASAQRAAALNLRLTGLSRRKSPDPQPVAIDALIGGMEDLLQSAMGGMVKLEFAVAPGLWKVHCDVNQAENAIVNLVLNARDAVKLASTITIEASNVDISARDVSLFPNMQAGLYVRMAVTDCGTGMNQDLIDRAFDAFVTTKHPGAGMGLGLAMVRRFARENGGDATIQSEVDRGTTVAMYLPRHVSGTA
jgi:PAS domain S-box-containing protein